MERKYILGASAGGPGFSLTVLKLTPGGVFPPPAVSCFPALLLLAVPFGSFVAALRSRLGASAAAALRRPSCTLVRLLGRGSCVSSLGPCCTRVPALLPVLPLRFALGPLLACFLSRCLCT
jgi:hypothetical protein